MWIRKSTRQWSVSQSQSLRSVCHPPKFLPPLIQPLLSCKQTCFVGLQSSGRQYPGQVNVNIGPLITNLTFESRDSMVTLLKNDHVLINLLRDIVTEKRRATNIRPKIPSTFSHTGETREKVSCHDFVPMVTPLSCPSLEPSHGSLSVDCRVSSSA